jgi:hypothetical protein
VPADPTGGAGRRDPQRALPSELSICSTLVRLMSEPVPTKEDTMKYMLLIQHGTAPTPNDPEAWSRLSPSEQQAVYADYQALNQTPGVSPGLQIQPAESATTVRVQDGRTLTTDGPAVPVEQALAGYLFFEADDLDGAIELASRIPHARLGGAVEVRPIQA